MHQMNMPANKLRKKTSHCYTQHCVEWQMLAKHHMKSYVVLLPSANCHKSSDNPTIQNNKPIIIALGVGTCAVSTPPT